MVTSPKRIPTVEILPGTILARVHRAGKGARYYGARDGTWRWDDPSRSYGILYLGEDPIASFAETLLRWPSTKRDVLWSDVELRRSASFRTNRTLTLAQLHGPGPAAFGVGPEALAGADYRDCQSVSGIVYGVTDLDGIRYRSRFENDLFCIALFERADDAIDLVNADVLIDRDWVFDMLKDRGYRLLDL